MIKIMKKIGLAVLATAAIGLFVNPYEKVYKIADGDTFILENNKQTIRLFGIDAPEMDNCYGPESYARLDELLKNAKFNSKNQ